MPRKKEVVKIDDREYTIQELTVGEIIDLTQTSAFFNGPLKDEGVGEQSKSKKKGEKKSPEPDDIGNIMSDFKKITDTCCDFGPEDLIELTPSQIRELYDGFKKVNADFLFSLKAMGVAEALLQIRDVALNRFSKTLVILLKQDM